MVSSGSSKSVLFNRAVLAHSSNFSALGKYSGQASSSSASWVSNNRFMLSLGLEIVVRSCRMHQRYVVLRGGSQRLYCQSEWYQCLVRHLTPLNHVLNQSRPHEVSLLG